MARKEPYLQENIGLRFEAMSSGERDDLPDYYSKDQDLRDLVDFLLTFD
jgi:hypothetical protein